MFSTRLACKTLLVCVWFKTHCGREELALRRPATRSMSQKTTPPRASQLQGVGASVVSPIGLRKLI